MLTGLPQVCGKNIVIQNLDSGDGGSVLSRNRTAFERIKFCQPGNMAKIHLAIMAFAVGIPIKLVRKKPVRIIETPEAVFIRIISAQSLIGT